ncbi:hypothetical protein VZT92_003249 [Zoarces viviparus]|uniref:Uncharacterized protein n=1 Tax=Zoarces viviparus TaxID=48416 RepID=A0AAW1G1X1_ZOAVI
MLPSPFSRPYPQSQPPPAPPPNPYMTHPLVTSGWITVDMAHLLAEINYKPQHRQSQEERHQGQVTDSSGDVRHHRGGGGPCCKAGGPSSGQKRQRAAAGWSHRPGSHFLYPVWRFSPQSQKTSVPRGYYSHQLRSFHRRPLMPFLLFIQPPNLQRPDLHHPAPRLLDPRHPPVVYFM